MDLAVLNLLIGLVLLLFGRQLFWLFVGVAGFVTGIELAERVAAGSETTKLLIALAIGIAGALLAILFYRVAVAVAGFLVGGYLAIQFANYAGVSPAGALSWLPWLIGGIIGVIIILALFDWALIALSSLAGAALVVNSISIPFNATVLFIILTVLGIAVQAGMFRRLRPAE